MGASTGISWCDRTFNPWKGCSKVKGAPGCANCYAEHEADIRYGQVKWGPRGTRVVTTAANWRQPLKWNRECHTAGTRERVFCASWSDVFEDWQGAMQNPSGARLAINRTGKLATLAELGVHRLTPKWGRYATMGDCRAFLFDIIAATHNLDWLLLTKRPENVRRMIAETVGLTFWMQHCASRVWLGTSVSEQKTADSWIPRLLELRDLAHVLFVSAEPLLGPIVFRDESPATMHGEPAECWHDYLDEGLDWVIWGGESFGGRACEVDWIRSGVEQCQRAGVATLVKQLGTNPRQSGDLVQLSHGKGAEMSEWPADLQVHEFPNSHIAS